MLQYHDREWGVPIHNDRKPGRILIRVEYAPINYNDLLLARGLNTIQPNLPSVVGNEGAGKVLAVGDGVKNVKIGDRVAC